MATIPMVLQQIRRARRRQESVQKASESRPSEAVSRFEEYRPAYEEILSAAKELADEEMLDEVAEWAVEWTQAKRRLPGPDTFRTHVCQILEEHGVEIPPESVLYSPPS